MLKFRDSQEYKAVNAKESKDLAQAFVSDKFLRFLLFSKLYRLTDVKEYFHQDAGPVFGKEGQGLEPDRHRALVASQDNISVEKIINFLWGFEL